jgi:hypothetical protein
LYKVNYKKSCLQELLIKANLDDFFSDVPVVGQGQPHDAWTRLQKVGANYRNDIFGQVQHRQPAETLK